MTSYSDFFGTLTYVDPLIFYKAEYHNNWQHREISVKKDVFLKKYIMTLDRAIFQELPIFVPDILGADESVEKPNVLHAGKLYKKETKKSRKKKIIDANELSLNENEKNEAILQDWENEGWSDLLIRMFDVARTHKWAIVQLYNNKPYWRVFSYRETMEIKYNEKDEPVSAEVMWAKQLPRASSFIYHEETLNFLDSEAFKPDKSGNPQGKALMVVFGSDLDEKIESTDIENIWSLDIYLRYIILDIINNSAKSAGFYHIKYGSQVDDDKKSDIDSLFEKANSGRAIGATPNLIEDIVAHYLKNPEFPVEALDKLLKLLSGACDLPLLYFNGEKEAGSIFEENSSAMSQVNQKMRKIFGQFKKYILKLVEMRWGIKCDDVFPNIAEEKDEQYSEDVIEKREGPSIPEHDGGNGAAEKIKVQAK